MIKKALFLLICLTSLSVMQSTQAQQKTGSWTVYPHIADSYTNVIDTPARTYFLMGGTLMHSSADDNEFYVYGQEKLSCNEPITNIFYNPDEKFLLIAYKSGNLDMLYDSGKVVNLPEIRDAVLTSASRTVNGIAFDTGRMYVATDFGLVVYNTEKHEVKESGVFDKKFTQVLVLGDNVVMTEDAGNNLRNILFAGRDEKLNRYSTFRLIDSRYILPDTDANIVRLSDNSFTFTSNAGIAQYEVDFSDPKINATWLTNTKTARPAQEKLLVYTTTDIRFIDGNGLSSSVTLPEKATNVFASSGDLASVWLETAEGLRRYDLSGSSATLKATVSRPEGFTTDEPVLMKWSNDGKRLYVGVKTANFINQNPGDNMNYPAYVDMVADGRISDVAPVKQTKANIPNSDEWTYIVGGRITSINALVEDPDDPSVYYFASNTVGGVVVKDSNVIQLLNSANTPIVPGWYYRTLDVNIDNAGNLWLGTGYVSDVPIYHMLPADKRKNILNVSKTDWHSVPNFFDDGKLLTREARSLFLKKNDGYMIVGPGDANSGIAVLDTRTTYENFADDRHIQLSSFTDSENNLLTPDWIQCLTEDRNGNLWIGTDQGLFYITDITEAFNADFRVKRPIVPRNDGTIYGDYLLDGESVYGIAVDPSNRKWIATRTSGVYLVSADGTEILEHFTSANSPLPSNIVECVAADPLSNIVYFGTPNGVVSYAGSSSPAAGDYSEVIAYPNPVRPDYTGWITIKGLMENSLVKIADSAGNVFFQTRSEGGMVTWDGCGADGQRVRSGVYYVFASQNSDGSSGAVAKIMVVN